MSNTPPPKPCKCCGEYWPDPPTLNTDRLPMHLRCWDEHHSDPTGRGWPPGHVCWVDDDPPEGRA